MTNQLDALTYFEHLRAYVNSRYVMHDGTGGEVVLQEKYFLEEGTRAETRKIRLLLPGPGLAFNLDYDQVESQRRKTKPPLFHFLDDTAKPWSKRCDFVIFYVNCRAFHVDLIEFKSKSLIPDKIVPQIKAGVNWVKSLKRAIEYYTDYSRHFKLRKFVFGENEKPGAYIDENYQLKADPSIRYYHFDEVQGQPLVTLQNKSVQRI